MVKFLPVVGKNRGRMGRSSAARRYLKEKGYKKEKVNDRWQSRKKPPKRMRHTHGISFLKLEGYIDKNSIF